MNAAPGRHDGPPLSPRPGRLAAAPLIPIALVGLWWKPGPTPRDLAIRLVVTYLAAWAVPLLLTRRPAALSRRFALMTGAIAVTLLLVEFPAVVGLVDYGSLFPANRVEPFLGRRDRVDADLLRLHPPHLRESGRTQGDLVVSTNTRVGWAPWYRYDVRYDARGFRNATDLDRAEIAVVGDSFVEGVQAPYESLMTTVLGRRLGVPVANLGQIKYGPREELAVLKRFALPLRPRVCVWAFFEGNDLADLRAYDRARQGGPAPPERRSIGDRSFVQNALLAAIRVAGLDRSRYREFYRRSGLVRVPGGEDVRLFFHYPSAPLTSEDEESLARLAEILRDARDAAERGGCRLVVVYIPTKFRVYGDLARFAADSPCAGWTPSDLPGRLRALVAGISPAIGFLDLTGPFRAEARRGPLLYYPDDTHWSPEGQTLAGRVLADDLAAFEAGR